MESLSVDYSEDRNGISSRIDTSERGQCDAGVTNEPLSPEFRELGRYNFRQ